MMKVNKGREIQFQHYDEGEWQSYNFLLDEMLKSIAEVWAMGLYETEAFGTDLCSSANL